MQFGPDVGKVIGVCVGVGVTVGVCSTQALPEHTAPYTGTPLPHWPFTGKPHSTPPPPRVI